MKHCRHARVARRTEADGCSWLSCLACGQRGRKCHSVAMAMALSPFPRTALVLV
jgi:hypothetical protein